MGGSKVGLGLVAFGEKRTDDGFRHFGGGRPPLHPPEVEVTGFGLRVGLGDESRLGDRVGGGGGGGDIGVAHRRNLTEIRSLSNVFFVSYENKRKNSS